MGSAASNAPTRYRRLAELGRGDMAQVFLAAVDGAMGVERMVVVKQMRAELADGPESRSRFLEEARVAMGLSHPNVVKTFEVVEDEPGSYRIVMEFLHGQPLSNLRTALRRELLFPLQLHIIEEALAGLEHVHAHGLVHRDVSPQNLFVTYEGDVKILDFGVAKSLDSSLQTELGVRKGKLSYMAPEQALGRPLDARTDVFAMGILLWETLTGRRLWLLNMPDAAILTHLTTRPVPPPSSVSSDVPRDLDAICMRALALSPDDRYPDVSTLRRDVGAFIASMSEVPSRGDLALLMQTAFHEQRAAMERTLYEAHVPIALVSALPAVSVASKRPSAVPPTQSGAPPARRRARGRRVWVGALLAALVAGAATGAIVAFGGRRAPAPVVRAEPTSPVELSPTPSATSSVAVRTIAGSPVTLVASSSPSALVSPAPLEPRAPFPWGPQRPAASTAAPPPPSAPTTATSATTSAVPSRSFDMGY